MSRKTADKIIPSKIQNTFATLLNKWSVLGARKSYNKTFHVASLVSFGILSETGESE